MFNRTKKKHSSDCHKNNYSNNFGLANIELYSQPGKESLIKRSGTNYDLVKDVCKQKKSSNFFGKND